MASPSKLSPFRKEKNSGVSFFNQFTKSFLRPYGPADSWENVPAIDWAKPINCEWLLRPTYALSELYQSVVDNMELLKVSPLVKPKKIKAVDEEMEELCEALAQFNTRDKEASPTTQHCNTIIKTMLANDSLGEFMEEAYQTGGALFIMSCHYLMARTLITDPEAYASKIALVGGGDEEFKKNSSVGNLRKIFLQSTSKKKPAKRNIAKMLQELKDEESDNEPPPKKKPKKKHIIFEDEEDDKAGPSCNKQKKIDN